MPVESGPDQVLPDRTARTGPEAPSLSAFQDHWVELVARNRSECEGGSPSDWAPLVNSSVAAAFAWQRAELALGTLQFDPSAARACLDRLARQPCFFPEVRCDAVVIAALPKQEGDACDGELDPGVGAEALDGFCAAGLYCSRVEPSGAWSCPARCRARVPRGQVCTFASEPCVRGALCGGGVCNDGLAAHQRCGPGQCSAGLYCAGNSVSCIPLRKPGEACFTEAQSCELGYACEVGIDRCEVPRPRRLGDACTPGTCSGPSACNAAGRCQRLPVLGEACGELGGERFDCFAGRCSAETGPGVCVELLPDGAPCQSQSDCRGRCAGTCEPLESPCAL